MKKWTYMPTGDQRILQIKKILSIDDWRRRSAMAGARLGANQRKALGEELAELEREKELFDRANGVTP